MSGHVRNPSAEFLSVYGCSAEQWLYFRDLGLRLVDAGETRDRTPLVAYCKQKRRAAQRGIEWELTFPQWWSIWDASGHWADRGKGQGFVMCRVGDVGAYAVGNVFIATGRQNSREAHRKDGLPFGVYRDGTRFRAKRGIHGQRVELGYFGSPDDAHRAYLEALPE